MAEVQTAYHSDVSPAVIENTQKLGPFQSEAVLANPLPSHFKLKNQCWLTVRQSLLITVKYSFDFLNLEVVESKRKNEGVYQATYFGIFESVYIASLR